ncbi:hypothetical protein BGZ49_001892 [Haplosporangium sp. Z 27]|nr:hypothetical protein BGZ49_001892 [Haplosporangium sp. Z 27]
MKFSLAAIAVLASIASTQAASGTVHTSGAPLNVHSAPSTSSAVVGTIKNGATVTIDCTATGTSVKGTYGTSTVWDHVPGGYVTDTYVYTGKDGPVAPACGGSKPPSTSGCQAPGISNPRTCAGAVSWLVSHLSTRRNSSYIGMCDKIMSLAYGRTHSGFNTAWIHWQSVPGKYKHAGDRNPPAGALVFFQGGKAGHVAISTGGANIISTDIGGAGTLTRSTISTIEKKWGQPMGLPRDSLERRRGGRGGPAPRRDRKEDGDRVAKRVNNDYNSQYKNSTGTKDGRVDKSGKKKGFNPMARAHMGSEAYKGHAKKLKADLIHKAKVKKEYAKVLSKEEENTPEFYKKIFGEKTIDDEGNIVAYNDNKEDEGDDDSEQEGEDISGSDEDEDMESGSDDAEEEEEEEEAKPTKSAKGGKGKAAAKTQNKPGKQEDGSFKRAPKPNPFKAAIEKREAEKKAIQEARDRAQRERALAKKGRDAYYANREKTTQKMREKTPRGQPVLANQIKMMLGKIKEEVKENKTRAPVQRWGGRGGRKNAGRGTSRGVKKGTSSAHHQA